MEKEKRYEVGGLGALRQRAYRWRRDGGVCRRVVGSSGGEDVRVWLVKRMDDELRGYLGEGERLEAVMEAARRNGWIGKVEGGEGVDTNNAKG